MVLTLKSSAFTERVTVGALTKRVNPNPAPPFNTRGPNVVKKAVNANDPGDETRIGRAIGAIVNRLVSNQIDRNLIVT